MGRAPSSVRSALREASAKKLVRTAKGPVELTPAGRRRLKVVMMGGAFEIIHPGHVHALSEARQLGNTLVVVVATDGSVERNKGRPPVTSQALRVGLVSSIRQVDLALPGNKGSIYEILLRIRPDVVALGYDQRHNGDEIVQEAAKRGIRISHGEARGADPGPQDLEDPAVALMPSQASMTFTSSWSPSLSPSAPRRKWGEIISRTLSS